MKGIGWTEVQRRKRRGKKDERKPKDDAREGERETNQT